MNINDIIETALAPTGLPGAPDVYTGPEDEYYTYSYTSSGDGYGDDAPHFERYDVTIHHCCSLSTDSVAKNDQIKRLLFAADFTWPDVINNTDDNGQDWIFECSRLVWIEANG